MGMKNSDAKNLAGYCGLFCGLCNKYQSKAPSRCLGCRLGEQHAWCSIWNCCVKKHNYESCSECEEVFHCDIFLRRKVIEWIPAAENLHRIKEAGFDVWVGEQSERQVLLEMLLQNYNEGRSMTFYCKACARMPIELINEAIKEARERLKNEQIDTSDLKSIAKILKEIITDLTATANINLK